MLTKSDLSKIGNVIEEKLESVRKDIKYLKKKVNRIDKTVDIIAKNYDEGDVELGRRMTKIEQYLDLPDKN